MAQRRKEYGEFYDRTVPLGRFWPAADTILRIANLAVVEVVATAVADETHIVSAVARLFLALDLRILYWSVEVRSQGRSNGYDPA